jgi:Fe-S-cluster containining protein
MTPTYTTKDMKRISFHLGMSVQEFKDKWLYEERSSGDWLNRSTPCQFLDRQTNMCTIYEVRPDDCAGFPHLLNKKLVDFVDTHKQNVEYCPATYRMVEKMMEKMKLSVPKPEK